MTVHEDSNIALPKAKRQRSTSGAEYEETTVPSKHTVPTLTRPAQLCPGNVNYTPSPSRIINHRGSRLLTANISHALLTTIKGLEVGRAIGALNSMNAKHNRKQALILEEAPTDASQTAYRKDTDTAQTSIPLTEFVSDMDIQREKHC
ncbi:hypothetical protein SKAU_G00208810 [Synaphobranchus kaupii]|uniref:Uncharacterized protein n=1 Tax=Synaphobranchus kaupii TaxID=118154 RepID=A0A9Q1IUC9_SYNKA|nr:hypothetical protein SKAU_G00208810 [Synaphobranchus kaupii]